MKLGYKYFIVTAILLFILTGLVRAQSNPAITKVESFVGYIRVEWTINSEGGIDHYEVWRSSGSSDPYLVGIVQRGIFYLEDRNSLYKTEDQYFNYQVRALGGPNGPVLGQSEIKGTHYNNTSSIGKRTWGSIKAMFR
jgi:hypothetical protein